MNFLKQKCTVNKKAMPHQKQKLINTRLFISSLCTLVIGYALMALAPHDFLRLTVSPLLILSGFGLVILSIIIPQKHEV